MTFFADTDHRIKLANLTDEDGNEQTAGTVTARVYESDAATEVTGFQQPISLTHQGGGTYEGIVPNSADTIIGNTYWFKVEADSGGRKRVWWSEQVLERSGFDQ